VEGAAGRLAAVLREVPGTDIFSSTAAVADYGTGEGPAGFEAAFVTFLRQRGH